MFLDLFRRQRRLPSPRLMMAYQAANQRLLYWLTEVVRNWETQSVHRRKWQLACGLISLLVLASLSIYFTATGHFFTRVTPKHYEHQIRQR